MAAEALIDRDVGYIFSSAADNHTHLQYLENSNITLFDKLTSTGGLYGKRGHA